MSFYYPKRSSLDVASFLLIEDIVIVGVYLKHRKLLHVKSECLGHKAKQN